jgi:hypothetical protein
MIYEKDKCQYTCTVCDVHFRDHAMGVAMRIMRKLLSFQLLKAGAITSTYGELFNKCGIHQVKLRLSENGI